MYKCSLYTVLNAWPQVHLEELLADCYGRNAIIESWMIDVFLDNWRCSRALLSVLWPVAAEPSASPNLWSSEPGTQQYYVNTISRWGILGSSAAVEPENNRFPF